jgi:CRP-like cAMP-binding protein
MDNSISGSVVTYAAGERLTTRGNDVDEIYIILKGRIRCMTTYGTYYLGPGSAAGLTDCYYGMYVFNYFADEDTMVKRYTVSVMDSACLILDILNPAAGYTCHNKCSTHSCTYKSF